jgi:glycosyltransferase involved in cell wall biosynthesis
MSQQGKHVLVVSYTFPPLGTAGSSIRVVKHIKYLYQMGWRFWVLTADRAHSESWQTHSDSAWVLEPEVPADVSICRTPALRIPTSVALYRRQGIQRASSRCKMASILTSVRKKIRPATLIFPDVYIPWLLTAVPAGIHLVRKAKLDVIYALSPPTTAIVVAFWISSLTKLPLVIDFKDDKIGTRDFNNYPRFIQTLHKILERYIVNRAHTVIAVTPSSYENFRQRYSDIPQDKFVFIPNGVDIQEFVRFTSTAVRSNDKDPNRRFVIINAGGYSPTYRNAVSFLKALDSLLEARPELRELIQVRFIGRGAKLAYGDLVARLGNVFIEEPPKPRGEYISALCQADALLLIQTLGYPTSIAGTFYEYWAAGRAPILVIGEPGDMWNLLHAHRLGFALHADDVDGIRSTIEMLVDAHIAGKPMRICANGIEQYDRQFLARKLGQVFMKVTIGQKEYGK